jgi:hypothetical protein
MKTHKAAAERIDHAGGDAMKTTLAILAVTVMKTGVCVAGVRPEAPATWIRPVREFGSVLLGDITYPAPAGASSPSGTRRIMRPFDLVELMLGRAQPDPPHVEDWTCDFAHARPRLLGSVPEVERAALLDAAAAAPDALWARGERSLRTLAVASPSAIFRHDVYSGKYEARLTFPGLPDDVASAACTDLAWRALGRRLLAERATPAAGAVRTLTLAGDALWEALGGGARRCWLVLGMTRAYDGRRWPLIVGVHTLPEYEADVDYSAL